MGDGRGKAEDEKRKNKNRKELLSPLSLSLYSLHPQIGVHSDLR